MIRRLAANNSSNHKKVLYLVPFVTLARERSKAFRRIFKDTGMSIACFAGDTPRSNVSFEEADIAIATFELGIFFLGKLQTNKELGNIGTIVVDEIHMVHDRSRGGTLEAALSNVRLHQEELHVDIQIIGMSATLGKGMQALATWLRAESFETDFRPVPLQLLTLVGTKLYQADEFNHEPLHHVTRPRAGFK